MLNKETKDFIKVHRHDDIRRLALTSAPNGVDLKFAIQQIEGRQLAEKKLPNWAENDALIFPPRLSMEQCSSEQTAIYKRDIIQRLCSGKTDKFTDLTGGFGIDFSFIAPIFGSATYMERQSVLCNIAQHNFSALGFTHTKVIETDSSAHPEQWEEVDCIFIDPARRDAQGRKTIAIEDCEPNLVELQDSIREKALFCLIKLSPMLDIHQALRSLQNISEVHAVSVQGECKELLFVMTRVEQESTIFHCANLGKETQTFIFTHKEEQNASCQYTAYPETYLYEPNASVMKCGGFQSIASRYNLRKLHPSAHLYTSSELIEDFPGRAFVIEDYTGFGKQELKNLLHDTKKANLTIRNFPSSVSELRKRLRIKEGGDCYLFATTTAEGEHILIKCRKHLSSF